jgi:hypothetical protein
MLEIKKIIYKILLIILDIALFTFQTARQLVLPNTKRKGNILSSLFIFFIGIVERLNHFEHGFFKIANIFKLKYLKQTVLIVAAFLFFLSSFEWKAERTLNVETITTTLLKYHF